jgi:hypothetical protein
VRRRVAAAKFVGDTALGLRVAEREEERDCDRLGVDLGERRQVERRELAVRPRASPDAVAALERHERRRMLDARPVQMRARLSPQVQDVLEALVRDERGSRASSLQERVRGDRRAVREPADLGGAERGRRCNDRLLLARGRRHLRYAHVAVLDEHRIGKRPTDVDPERAHRAILDDRPR